MGAKELIEALLKEADEKVSKIREATEAECEAMGNDLIRKTEELRREYEDRTTAGKKDISDRIVTEAEKKARAIRLSAESALTARLYESARNCLSALRDDGYEQKFNVLAKELPEAAWETVSVNPEDVLLARKAFGAAEVVADVNIKGGMVADTESGRIEVNNTLEKRLEGAWPSIVSSIVRDIYERFDA